MIADDLKYGWRQLIKAPGFSITAILTLGLAIGANTAVFSLVDAVLLKSIAVSAAGTARHAWARSTRAMAPRSSAASMAVTGAGWEALQNRRAASMPRCTPGCRRR